VFPRRCSVELSARCGWKGFDRQSVSTGIEEGAKGPLSIRVTGAFVGYLG